MCARGQSKGGVIVFLLLHVNISPVAIVFSSMNENIFQVSESSLLAHTASLGNRPFAWPIILMGCAAAIALVVLALTVIFAVRKWSSKPSRVNSVQGDPENGTDV